MKYHWKTSRREISWEARPLLMGILNITPDSFSDGGLFIDPEKAVAHAEQMVAAGADIIDVGGESTRPGAAKISVEEELRRVVPVIERLSARISVPLSIDTTKARVAEAALQAGAEIVNDVSGGRWDSELWKITQQARAGYVLMHAQGTPETMQQAPRYEDVVVEVRIFLQERLLALQQAGIAPAQIVCDLGIGFGKTVDHNLALLDHLEKFLELGFPLLIGVSRKSFLKKIGGEPNLELSTLAAQVWASARGAAIWRVHEVSAAMAAARMVEALRTKKTGL